MFRLAHPTYLYLLLLIPVFFSLFLLLLQARKSGFRKMGEWTVVSRLIPGFSAGKSWLKFILLMLAWTALVIGLADPQTGSKLEKIKRKGIDLVFVLDVSNSMLAQDISPNRLARAKQAISSLVESLEDDRIGLVVFGGEAFVQMPLTTDFASTRLFLSNVNPGIVPVQGTAIGSAIETAAGCFGESKQSKAVILITDGENWEDDALEATKNAAGKGIRVYTIGMGLEEGAPIPVYSGSIQIGYKKDAAGNTVVSRLDENLLKEIAQAGKGSYVRASNASAGVKEIFDQISNLEKNEYDARVFSDYEDRFGIFLFIALILLVIEMLIPDRKSSFAQKFLKFKSLQNRTSLTAGILTLLLALSATGIMAQQAHKMIRKGNSEYSSGKFKDAEIDYRKALEKAPASVKANYNLGNALYKQNQYEEAARAYLNLGGKKISQSDQAKVFHNLGNSMLQSKKYQESVSAYKQALRLNPGDEDTRYNLAYAMSMLKQQQQQNDRNKDKKQDKQQQQQQQQKDQEQKKQDQNQKMSKQDAARMLNAMNDKEKRTLDKAKKMQVKASRYRPEKDW